MALYATSDGDWESWDYIVGNTLKGMSIASDRFFHLADLDKLSKGTMKITMRDPNTGAWSKKGWVPFSESHYCGKKGYTMNQVQMAYDIHRSVLSNEVIIESDYPDYEENVEASRLIGRILEAKGFSPSYYYSGGKSIHIHIFFDFTCLLTLDMKLQEYIVAKFERRYLFVRKFMEWLRGKMINCWDTQAKKFDEGFIKATHLIRSEMSKNKKGYKTFIGTTYKDISCIPRICNERNRIYPELGPIMLSRPTDPKGLMEEFLADQDKKKRLQKVRRKEAALSKWIRDEKEGGLSPMVNFILSDEFKEAKDGYKRGMFILSNELKRVHGKGEALRLLLDWNKRMGFPILESEIEYRMKVKNYTLTQGYIQKFLQSLGFSQFA